jgi:uncharacterized membrane protein YgdD (TMEM256/DUF423 family)
MVSDFGEGISSQDQTIAGERKDPRHDPATTGGTVLGSVHPPAYGRGLLVSIVAAAIVFALAIFASGGTEESTGIPMTQTTGSLFWGLSILAIILVGVASQYAEGAAIRVAESLGQEPARRNQLPSAWAVPAASMATALLLVATYHNKVMLIAGPAIAFLGVAGGLFARDLLEDTMEGAERTAALIHTIVIHAIAFLGLSAVYMNKMSGWYGAPMVFLLTAVLMFEHLERAGLPDGLRLLYSLLSGGVMILALLAVNWWPTYGWTGGAALLLCFFVLAGLGSVRGERQSLRDRDLIEYGAVFIGGLLILAITM